jgi:hypothetical protein
MFAAIQHELQLVRGNGLAWGRKGPAGSSKGPLRFKRLSRSRRIDSSERCGAAVIVDRDGLGTEQCSVASPILGVSMNVVVSVAAIRQAVSQHGVTPTGTVVRDRGG